MLKSRSRIRVRCLWLIVLSVTTACNGGPDKSSAAYADGVSLGHNFGVNYVQQTSDPISAGELEARCSSIRTTTTSTSYTLIPAEDFVAGCEAGALAAIGGN
jgi:hypothetical protein